MESCCQFCRGTACELLLDNGWYDIGIRTCDEKMQKWIFIHDSPGSTLDKNTCGYFAQEGCYSLINQPYGLQVRLCNLCTVFSCIIVNCRVLFTGKRGRASVPARVPSYFAIHQFFVYMRRKKRASQRRKPLNGGFSACC